MHKPEIWWVDFFKNWSLETKKKLLESTQLRGHFVTIQKSMPWDMYDT
jgi:hypothetical protein